MVDHGNQKGDQEDKVMGCKSREAYWTEKEDRKKVDKNKMCPWEDSYQ